MQYVYHPKAGESSFEVDVREYEHLFKVRRSVCGDIVQLRNLRDHFLYDYKIVSVGKKNALFECVASNESAVLPLKNVHVGWCVIDPKLIEKTLPMLNELGVTKLSFIYAEFSQKNHKLDFERMQRILINSSQQCGRTTLMALETFASLKEFLEMYPKTVVIDFSEKKLEECEDINSVLIGPEGGFSVKERALYAKHPIYGLKCNTILRSETAVIASVSKILA